MRTQESKTRDSTSNRILHTIAMLLLAATAVKYVPADLLNPKNWQHSPAAMAVGSILATSAAVIYFMSRPRKVYLVDFACYKPDPATNMITKADFLENLRPFFSEEDMEFQRRILDVSGLSDKTSMTNCLKQSPPKLSFGGCMEELQTVMFGAIDDLLAKTKVNPSEIGVVVTNISMFNPTPSVSAMIVNRYKLRDNVLAFSLGGMGCSASPIAVDLAHKLLKRERNTYALVFSMEVLGESLYLGRNRSMLMENCLFRMGGSAMLLSNRASDKGRSKYRLIRTVRTHMAADDIAHKVAYQQDDEEGILGVSLSKDLMRVAGDALRTNIKTLAPLVLPMSEKLRWLVSMAAGNKNSKKEEGLKKQQFVPDFTKAFEHFCIHCGGKSVLNTVQKSLHLSDELMEPSRMTLYRFGNTSSSSLWYELAYCEAKGRVKKGDRVWQIGFGSGFKCNSSVWRALKTIDPVKEKNAWTDEIHEYPVKL